jgi:nucleotide-binding universal stress UspA family protein
MQNNVLVPLDGSDLAEVAIEYAEQVARALGGGIILFGVVQSDAEHHLYLPATPVVEAPRDVWERWEAQLGTADEELRQEVAATVDAMSAAAFRVQAAGLAVEREVGVGNPRDVIVRRAAGHDVAMIVMASHGRTGLARLVRGSVASGVVDHTRRPTLIVRPFRDPEHRLDLEHADQLRPEQGEAVRHALTAAAR